MEGDRLRVRTLTRDGFLYDMIVVPDHDAPVTADVNGTGPEPQDVWARCEMSDGSRGPSGRVSWRTGEITPEAP